MSLSATESNTLARKYVTCVWGGRHGFSFAALLKRQIIRRDFHAASRDLRKELNAFFVLKFASEHELAFAPETIAKVLLGARDRFAHSLILTRRFRARVDLRRFRGFSRNPRWPMERKCRARVTCRVIPTSLR